MSTTTRSLVVVIAYAVLGWLGLLLAIPPGYATPVWPAAGLALAATLVWGSRVVPAVALASFAVNVSLAYGTAHDGASIAPSVIAAAGIGVGAGAQAFLGAWLVRRFVRFPPALADVRVVGKMLVLCGPIACVANATFGVTSLWTMGVVTTSQLGFSWVTWWVGDVIGVLVVLPMALLEVAEPRDLWRRRRLSLVVPILLGSALLVGFFVYASDREGLRLQAGFRQRTSQVTRAIHGAVEGYRETLDGIARSVDETGGPDRAAFDRLVARARRSRPAIEDVAWVVEPSHDPPRGIHVGPTDLWRAAVERARTSRRSAATAPARTPDGATRVALLAPIAADGSSRGAGHVRGIAVARIDPGRLVRDAVDRIEHRGIDLRVSDVARDGRSIALVVDVPWITNGSTTRGGARSGRDHRADEPAMASLDEATVAFADHTWRVTYTPSPDFAFLHKSWDAWSVLALGLLFTSLMGAFQLTVTGRSVANEVLLREGAEALARSEAALRVTVEKLERSLGEKDVLLGEVHHRVKNNLQIVSSLLSLQYPDSKALPGIDETRGRIASIALVHERLYRSDDLSKVGIAEYLRTLADALTARHRPGGGAVEVVVDASDVELGVDRAIPCGMIANELVTNALKHAFPGDRGGTIRVSLVRAAEGSIALVVEDDGAGMRSEATRRDGLGMRLVSTLASQIRGRVTTESTRGTKVSVIFPIT